MGDSQATDKSALEAALQQKYIELLEKRIGQLEAVVSAAEQKDKAKDEEGKKKDTNKKEDPTTGGRYLNATREWDNSSASYKDDIVAESSFKKSQPKNVAYIFRRVIYDTALSEKRAYSELEIEDLKLIELLKSVIDNKYPGVNFDGNRVYMQAPFPAIIHNWDKLKERAEQDPDTQECKDLRHLLGRIEAAEELEDYFKTRDANSAAKVTTFETLWTVFAPKTKIVVKSFMGIPQLLQVSSSPVPYVRSNIKNILNFYMRAWCWDWNGKRMVKVRYFLRFKRFQGTKEISDLDYYPVEYHTESKELCDEVRKRSVKFLMATKFVNNASERMFKYEGNAYVARRKIVSSSKEDDEDDNEAKDDNDDDDVIRSRLVPIKGEVICDAQAYLQYAHSKRSHAMGEMEHEIIEEPATEIEDVLAKVTKEDVLNGVHDNNDELLILPPRFMGYATREKLWGQFCVDWTSPPPEPNREKFHKNLQLDKEYKDLIDALVKSHESGQAGQVQDMVSDKGKGLVLLLHGPPGVGKTLTAETIAEATGKPLFVVSVAEIGLDASRAEKNLEKLFNLATKWEAILLVDEADVFLETRGSTSDASRNALVSVLLRVLEYYKGIIILTTNRIKSIDVAVISRIHLAIRYTDLRDDQMKSIFKFFLDQLEPQWIKDRSAINKFIDDTGHHYGLNGRQIRNVVSAALAAARRENDEKIGDGRLTETHLRKVCEMTRDFQEQLKDHAMQQRYQNEARGFGGYR